MKHPSRVIAAVLGTVVLVTAVTTNLAGASRTVEAVGSQTGTAPGVTAKTIKIGYITSQTGIAASTFKGGDQGALARIKLQNARGGVNGRKIVLIAKDDGAAGFSIKTPAQDLVENEGVFGIIAFSAFVVGDGANYLNEKGVPVTGTEFDGPEWGQAQYSNMFSYGPPAYTPLDGNYYTYDGQAKFLKSIGVTKLATLGFGISASSTASIKAIEAAAKSVGIGLCYENLSVQFGQTSFPTEALAIKQAGCDGVVSSMVDSSDVGLAAALAQSGVTAKAFYYTGYDQSILDDANATAALEGAYFSGTPNFTKPTAATKAMLATIKKYGKGIPKGIPTFGIWGSYMAADIMIRGLELAGKNPTRELFISKMRAESGYTGGGLFPAGANFTGQGTKAMFPAKACTDYVQLRKGKFVVVKKNLCGKLLAFTK